ncbi:MAG: MFS transporter [Candidatus Kerfeldbacteria bacterium]|nr:MFS transporter [Candidatus Kerfeldbacteria bacterium]
MLGNSKKMLGQFTGQRSPIFIFALVVLFWTIFDSTMQYITPLLIEERGFSKSMIGLIIGTSSMTGAAFDFLICKLFKSTNFRRIFLVMFAICFMYPLLLWQAHTVWLFLLAMAVWGIYFDLYGFGTFNFIGRYTKKANHSASFGIVQIFRALGGILAPLIIGFVIINQVDWRSFMLSLVFLVVGFIFFIVLVIQMRKHRMVGERYFNQPRRKNLFIEVHLWKKLGKLMMPVLVMTFYLFFIEAFFWTLAPLYAETTDLNQFGGLFLAAYTLPALIVGWLIDPLTRRFGKKRTAFTSLFLGSLILSTFIYLPNSLVAIIVVFIASAFISMALPAINAAYADYIFEAPQVEGEIEGLEDFSFNIGYVLGPMLAGLLADMFSIAAAFSLLGFLGAIVALVLLIITPKHIIIKTQPSEL